MAQLSVEEALALVLDDVEPLPAEHVPVGEAHGRVLAADLEALRSQPPAAISAMDGYAVRAADVAGAPVELRLIGEVAAGRPFDGLVGAGEAARIFTGGVLPAGSDSVVVQEKTERRGDVVVVSAAVNLGKNVREAALDFKSGDVLLARGRHLTARDAALAAAMNHATVSLHRRARVALLATGDELVRAGAALRPGQIVHSNGVALSALARNEGADVIDLGIVPDRLEPTIAAVDRARASGADVLVTTGGASVGDHDLVHKALAACGIDLSFWKIAVRPGRPVMHGRIDHLHVLGLPGNPVSAFVCSLLFLTPLLRRLAGRTDLHVPTRSARLGRDLPKNDERQDYLRATLDHGKDGLLIATPLALQDSSMMVPLARAGCLVVREPFAPAARAGDTCRIIKLGL